ncbi:His-Xaa-Ser repeat protein HxsA [Mameliella alba]|uniref:His-Xaa-Ser repeat protein HxsA n=1 Tax=Mameliella alba TaxID=561184 RepID=A0A0B3RYG3_9RHOB|nr:His-Xaa-Ser repeat protein HxsA [Mameliella alba]
MKRLILYTFYGVFALAGPAVAQDPHVVCVQRQLDALGFDPGPADGAIGPQTRGALGRLVSETEAREALEVLPGLSARAALGWCREIARLYPEARGPMPSSEGPQIWTPEGFDPMMRLELQIAFDEVARYFEERFGVALASRVQLVAANDPESLGRILRAAASHQEVGAAEVRRTAERNCRKSSRIGASMYRHHMVFCWREEFEAGNTARFEDFRVWLRRVMAHEFTHHLQRELAYDKVPQWVRRGQSVRPRMGPAWMVEGGAQVIEYRYIHDIHDSSLPRTKWLRLGASRSGLTLDGIRRKGEVREPNAYSTSFYAVHLLTERFGEETLVNYWRRLGETDRWETAFEDVFGIAMQDFERIFPTLTADPDAAQEFLANRDLDGDGLIAGSAAMPAPGNMAAQRRAQVVCVQRQLAALGLSPGAADGVPGPRTRAALADFVQRQGGSGRAVFDLLPDLSPGSAVAWCREIGATAPEAAELLPSAAPPEVVLAAEVPEAMGEVLRDLYGEARDAATGVYGLRAATAPVVIYAQDADELTGMLRRDYPGALGLSENEAGLHARSYCGAGADIARLATDLLPGRIVLCLPEEVTARLISGAASTEALSRRIAYDHAHHLLAEIGLRDPLMSDGVAGLRPAWMVIGTARGLARGRPSESGALPLVELQRDDGAMPLAQLRSRIPARLAGASATSELAVVLLSARYGEARLTEFWRRVAAQGDWKSAFETVYGQSVTGFEGVFETLRRDETAARAYATGQGAYPYTPEERALLGLPPAEVEEARAGGKVGIP